MAEGKIANLCECGCGKTCNNRFVLGHNGRGIPRSKEEIAKMQKTMSDPNFRKQWKENISNGWTSAIRQKHRELNLGKTLSDEHKEKIGKGNKGKVRTDEVKEKISNTLKGVVPGDKNSTNPPVVIARFKGKNNNNWKGGSSRCYKTGYYSTDYISWRKAVFERDKYACKGCGETNRYLTVHHIKSFAHYPELRFDVNNGMTLCEDCHSKTDNYKRRNKKKSVLTI